MSVPSVLITVYSLRSFEVFNMAEQLNEIETIAQFERARTHLSEDSLLHDRDQCLEVSRCSYCVRCHFCTDCEHCYGCTYCTESKYCTASNQLHQSEHCHHSTHMLRCKSCHHSQYLIDCVGCNECSYCYGCVGLSRKEFHILNKPYDRKTYFAFLEKMGVKAGKV